MDLTRSTLGIAALALGLTASSPLSAQTLTLSDVTDLPVQTNTPTSYSFVADSALTTLSFAGYDVRGDVFLYDLTTQQNGAGANLLSGTYALTPAASGSSAGQIGNSLDFSGTTAGSFDTYTTSFASIAGAKYIVSFILSQDIAGSNGLRITAAHASPANSTGPGAVPEPATWLMMMVGFGAMGMALRREKQSQQVTNGMLKLPDS